MHGENLKLICAEIHKRINSELYKLRKTIFSDDVLLRYYISL